MRILKYFFLVVFSVFYTGCFSQDWGIISDSTYNHIVKGSFLKNNWYFGIGVTVPEYNNTSYKFGFQPKIGYFFRKKLMLNVDVDFLFLKDKIDSSNNPLYYNHYLYENSLRYYFKDNYRTFYTELGPLIGYVDYNDKNNNILGGFVLGAKGEIGFSVFIRNFKFEVAFGLKVYSPDFLFDNLAIGTYFQLTLFKIHTERLKKH